MTCFEIAEVSGHTADVGHIWALCKAQDHRDTHGDLVHGVCIHILNPNCKFSYFICYEYLEKFDFLFLQSSCSFTGSNLCCPPRKVSGRGKEERKNNANFSGHYVRQRTHNVRANALRLDKNTIYLYNIISLTRWLYWFQNVATSQSVLITNIYISFNVN